MTTLPPINPAIPRCPQYWAKDVIEKGVRTTHYEARQRWGCNRCGHTFTNLVTNSTAGMANHFALWHPLLKGHCPVMRHSSPARMAAAGGLSAPATVGGPLLDSSCAPAAGSQAA